MSAIEESVTSYFVIFNLKIEDRVESYAIEIDKVREIRSVESITKVPNTDHILGIINLRGKIISIVDMKYILGFGHTDRNLMQKILIVEIKNNILGLLVDDVEQVAKMNLKEVEYNTSMLDVDYIKGIIKMQDKLVLIIDLEKLFGDGVG